MSGLRSGEVACLWRLPTEGAAFSALGHMVQQYGSDPERLLQPLLRLPGQLRTLSKVVVLADLRAYRHDAVGPGCACVDSI
ncbi:type VI secretion system baseplate subunit TssK, partial [Burkholderia thailandensis]|uniref:type VI secretion system baseplate subunit TssK n=1 Tax=Burkholderia thailandensis TaxID=57975 RepID=UPI0035C6F05A